MKPTGNGELDALLAAARALPEERGEQGERGLDTVLAAFNAAGTVGGEPVRRRPPAARPWWMTGRFAAKWAVALVVVGGGVATASAGALPDPMQRLAHNMLGAVGVHTPDKPSAAPGGGPTASLNPASASALASATAPLPPSPPASAAAPSGTAAASPGAADGSLTALCRQVVDLGGNKWRKVLSAADQAALIAAAGKQNEVVPYCESLLADAQATQPTQTAQTTASASPAATATKKGKGHSDATATPAPSS
jgi:hypothetical protein